MLNEFKLLIVEDDAEVIETYKSTITTFHRKQNYINNEIKYEFSIDIANSKAEAIDKIDNNKNSYDGAIIDLDLNGLGGEDASGLEIIQYIKEHERFPVFIISGTTHQLIDEEDITQNDLYKIFTRGEEFSFIDEFIKIHSTGITDILNRTGKIEEYINTIYWNHLSTSLKPWMEDKNRSIEDKKQSLIRYCIMHLQEYLDISDTDNKGFSDYFPAEFFITGPIKEQMFTGDIFKYDNCRYVAITPACDFSNNKADRVLCLKINTLKEIDNRFIPDSMSNSSKKELERFLTNNKPRYHFIPSFYYKNKTHDAGIIDFQNQKSFDYQEITNSTSVERIATISQPFLKDLIERYSRYYARQGAPNISREQLQDNYLK